MSNEPTWQNLLREVADLIKRQAFIPDDQYKLARSKSIETADWRGCQAFDGPAKTLLERANAAREAMRDAGLAPPIGDDSESDDPRHEAYRLLDQLGLSIEHSQSLHEEHGFRLNWTPRHIYEVFAKATERENQDAVNATPHAGSDDKQSIESSLASLIEEINGEPIGSGAAPPTTQPNRFELSGECWTITYDGSTIQMKDSRGLQDIAHLISLDGESVSCMELMAGYERKGMRPSNKSDGGSSILDRETFRSVKQRLGEIPDEIDAAERDQEFAKCDELEEEHEAIVKELRKEQNHRGRSRVFGDDPERARKAVERRISRAIDAIRDKHQSLHLHLLNSVKTGIRCRYQPEQRTAWTTKPHP